MRLTQSNCLYILIIVAIAINFVGIFSPVLNSNDAYFYAVISKNILLRHDWINLFYANNDWLDKPHIPFWLTALSFYCFGINAFAYVLPGFIFYLIGAYYTFCLAKQLYNRQIGLLSALIYLTSLHLLLSSMDIRAEAYLLGEIMPACYYWWAYAHKSNLASWRNLCLASLFTALAMMTKGIFVLVTIFSGLVVVMAYTKRFKQLFTPKWLMAYLLSLIFILPELLSLYWQFDAHPEKFIYGHNHVSGIRWFFWDSQFGRFFNSGPIVNKHGNPLFFVHTLLWAFLPWSLLFLGAIITNCRQFNALTKINKINILYLLGSFLPTFILFSATKFQLDHYTNILIPFIAIFLASYLFNLSSIQLLSWSKIQGLINGLLALLNIILLIWLFHESSYFYLAGVPILILLTIIYQFSKHNVSLISIVSLSSSAILSAFVLLMLINSIIYSRYDAGYTIAQYFSQYKLSTQTPIYSWQVNGLVNNLAFHASNPVDSIESLPSNYPYYVVLPTTVNLNVLDNYKYQKIAQFKQLEMQKLVPSLLNPIKLQQNLIMVELIKINGIN